MNIVIEGGDIGSLPEECAELLAILGHPEALVTDESWVGDFIDPTLRDFAYAKAKDEIWDEIERRYPGIAVRGVVSLLELARAMRVMKNVGRA